MAKKTEVAVSHTFYDIKDMLTKTVAAVGDKVAYKFRSAGGVTEITYKQFGDQVHFIGTELHSMGLSSSHIGCSGENSYNWICVYLAALCSSGVFCPVDKDLPENDFAYVVDNGDSEIIFVDQKREELCRSIREKLPKVKYFVCFDRKEDDGEFLSFEKFVARGKEKFESGNKEFLDLESDINALKMLIYTSGTTGIAKGVMLSGENISSLVYYGLAHATIRDVGLSVLPYHHSYEAVAGLLVAIHNRSTLIINDSLKRVLKNLQDFHPQCVYLVPAFVEVFYRRIWATIEEQGKTKLIKTAIKVSNALRKVGIDIRRVVFKQIHENFGGKLEKIICGGAPIRPELAKFFDDIGFILVNGYGITECSPLVSVNREDDNDPSTVGVKLECIDVKISDLTSDGDGEICVKGKTVMMGYYKNPEATAEVFDEDGYFKTGDYGRIDEHNHIVITGRKKNIIILGNGKNIYPEEIENYIGNIPYVLEAVVYGAKGEDGIEEALCAEATVDEAKLAGLDKAAIEAKLKSDIFKELESLPVYKQVTQVVVRETPFVKTTSNKIKRDKNGAPLK